MSTVIVNKVDLDLVDLELEQTGDSTTDMFFQEPVLDYTRDYVVAVSELSVPLQEEPMLSNRIKNSDLMYIRKKVAGQDDTHPDRQITGDFAGISTFRTTTRISSPADFVRHVNKFFLAFATYYAQPGPAVPVITANHADYKISAEISPSGILDILAPGHWWNTFYIELTPFGREILGYSIANLALRTYDELPRYIQFSRVAGVVLKKVMFDANDDFIIDQVAWNTNHAHNASHSMLRYVEHRIRVELDADLSIPANVLVENGEQKMHYNIGSFPIRHDYSGSIQISTDNQIIGVGLESPIYIGNVLLKSRSDNTTDWYKISSAANIQNMRLNLIMLRREWDSIKDTWVLVRNPLVLDKKAVWNATLKFVQTF